VPLDEEDTMNFYAFDKDAPEAPLLAFGAINSMEDELGNNTIIFEAEVIENEYTNIGIGMTTRTEYTLYALPLTNENTPVVIPLILKGVVSGALPNDESALTGRSRDYGYWGNIFADAFIPSSFDLQDKVGTLKNSFSEAVPFVYFYDVKDTYSNISVNNASADLTFQIPITGGNNMQMSFLDTSSDDIVDFSDGIRPYLIGALWIFFGLYLFNRIADMGTDG